MCLSSLGSVVTGWGGGPGGWTFLGGEPRPAAEAKEGVARGVHHPFQPKAAGVTFSAVQKQERRGQTLLAAGLRWVGSLPCSKAGLCCGWEAQQQPALHRETEEEVNVKRYHFIHTHIRIPSLYTRRSAS